MWVATMEKGQKVRFLKKDRINVDNFFPLLLVSKYLKIKDLLMLYP